MEYNVKSDKPAEFINDELINKILSESKEKANDKKLVNEILDKARTFKGLTKEEVAILTFVEEKELEEQMFTIAKEIKEHIYGKRIVMFAPLYVSNYCVNECKYCGYHHSSCIQRRKLTQEELEVEVKALERLGHKRIALEAGEDPVNCDLDYILECMNTIYNIKCDNGSIRRINVNIAATTVEDYKRLKAAGIGTYILFQETFHKPTYEFMHEKGPKRNYDYHTTALGRAMEAGIDDVGMGVLYGLYDWHYEMVASMMFVNNLEARFGVGPHTISVPRIRAAVGVDSSNIKHIVNDDDFKKIVAIYRLAVPYTGIIISTREEPTYRDEIINLGVSQVSAGSCTGVGGYALQEKLDVKEKPQFEVADHRTPTEMLKNLMQNGYIPSFCTACYREGRTGDRFMQLAKAGQICNVCGPNALLTLKEYSEDYGDDEFKELASKVIEKGLTTIKNEKIKEKAIEYLDRIAKGERDFRF